MMRSAAVDCLDETTITRFFAGELSLDGLGEIEHHVDECSNCLDLIAAVSPLFEGKRAGPAAGSADDLRPGDVVAGRYRIDDLLGAGASGYVFSATDTEV